MKLIINFLLFLLLLQVVIAYSNDDYNIDIISIGEPSSSLISNDDYSASILATGIYGDSLNDDYYISLGSLPYSTTSITPAPLTNTTIEVSEYSDNTRNVVFSALALLSIVFILLAAVLIISIFKTGGDVTEMITTAGTLIGLAIIIIVGYIVINMVSKFV